LIAPPLANVGRMAGGTLMYSGLYIALVLGQPHRIGAEPARADLQIVGDDDPG